MDLLALAACRCSLCARPPASALLRDRLSLSAVLHEPADRDPHALARQCVCRSKTELCADGADFADRPLDTRRAILSIADDDVIGNAVSGSFTDRAAAADERAPVPAPHSLLAAGLRAKRAAAGGGSRLTTTWRSTMFRGG